MWDAGVLGCLTSCALHGMVFTLHSTFFPNWHFEFLTLRLLYMDIDSTHFYFWIYVYSCLCHTEKQAGWRFPLLENCSLLIVIGCYYGLCLTMNHFMRYGLKIASNTLFECLFCGSIQHHPNFKRQKIWFEKGWKENTNCNVTLEYKNRGLWTCIYFNDFCQNVHYQVLL